MHYFQKNNRKICRTVGALPLASSGLGLCTQSLRFADPDPTIISTSLKNCGSIRPYLGDRATDPNADLKILTVHNIITLFKIFCKEVQIEALLS